MIRIVKAGEYEAERKTRTTAPAEVAASVAEIIDAVASRGDDALREYTQKFDGCMLDSFELDNTALEAALREAGPEYTGVMERAAKNIENFHNRQIRHGYEISGDNGVILGQRILPINRVCIYVPGGTAAYPSTVLMNCIPAKLAGVTEIIITTPPRADGNPLLNGVDAGILAAAKIAGVDRVFTIGGAQAIAAAAYGTETFPRADKITGPGNAFVAEAKRQVFGIVGIDMIAGPSDVLIIADGNADPVPVAADMLSQCEHGSDSVAILITDSDKLAYRVSAEIETQLISLSRMNFVRESIDRNGRIIVADSIRGAFDISNELAPEHLEIFLENPFDYLKLVNNAGSVFLGKNAPVALGDYYAGPNHTLPTAGTARFSSPVSVDDFVKRSSYTFYTANALRSAGDDIVRFAEKEGLTAHALSVSKRRNTFE